MSESDLMSMINDLFSLSKLHTAKINELEKKIKNLEGYNTKEFIYKNKVRKYDN